MFPLINFQTPWILSSCQEIRKELYSLNFYVLKALFENCNIEEQKRSWKMQLVENWKVTTVVNIAENCVKFLFRELAELTNRLICNSQRKALMNKLSFMMILTGQKELTQKPQKVKLLSIWKNRNPCWVSTVNNAGLIGILIPPRQINTSVSICLVIKLVILIPRYHKA